MYKMFGKENQKGITRKLRNGKQSLFCATLLPDLTVIHVHIPMKLHVDILNSY